MLFNLSLYQYNYNQTLHFVELFDHDFAAGVKSSCASYKFR